MNKGFFILAAAMLAGSTSVHGEQQNKAVVAVRFLVTEQSAERLEDVVMSPLERILVALPRASSVASTASHGAVDLEIKFDGGATEQDREAVTKRVAELALDSDIGVISRTVQLASPHLK